ncbi:hypothetical protein FJK98_02445 [Micromonospora sp. HM134]|uniref:hypothetical protein n=1 Tax=Micromonospora sp. HM134 TaxID=2583243 RepID=UPI00119873E6|nr:hypothetical protein [Micromonospora sp. HM134]QDY06161.1 hypothetical protein FJK98_02445 [Micromonospora sp. HM134]
MAESYPNRGKWRITKSGVDNLTLRVCVFTGTQTGVHTLTLNTVADLDAVSGVSIHSERVTLTGVTVTQDDANNRASVDCADLAFAAAPGVVAQGVAIYHEIGASDAQRELLSVHTTNFPKPMDGGLSIGVADFLRQS